MTVLKPNISIVPGGLESLRNAKTYLSRFFPGVVGYATNTVSFIARRPEVVMFHIMDRAMSKEKHRMRKIVINLFVAKH